MKVKLFVTIEMDIDEKSKRYEDYNYKEMIDMAVGGSYLQEVSDVYKHHGGKIISASCTGEIHRDLV